VGRLHTHKTFPFILIKNVYIRERKGAVACGAIATPEIFVLDGHQNMGRKRLHPKLF